MIFNNQAASGIEIKIKNYIFRIGKFKYKQPKNFHYAWCEIRNYKMYELDLLNLGIALHINK